MVARRRRAPAARAGVRAVRLRPAAAGVRGAAWVALRRAVPFFLPHALASRWQRDVPNAVVLRTAVALKNSRKKSKLRQNISSVFNTSVFNTGAGNTSPPVVNRLTMRQTPSKDALKFKAVARG